MKYALECNCGHRCTVTAEALPRHRNNCPGCGRPTADAHPQGSIEYATVVAEMRDHVDCELFASDLAAGVS